MTKEIETFDQCPRALPCSFCSCIMKLVMIEEKQLVYKCPCCQKYKSFDRITSKL